MSENNLYYIYIDSKIEGTIDQLMSYFQAGVLHADDCICVYFKYYKDIEKYIHKTLSATPIRFKFVKRNSDLQFQSNKAVLYLFNAQSNCKITARRDLTHIFVTHGESHKLASIKPIIRIYDFVLTSGQLGIDRYLKAGIFNRSHIEDEQRILAMGDTFIGQNIYQYDPDCRTLLYAPTWEGGVPQENYSSIGMQGFNILQQLIVKYQIQQICIQAHPNLGHRDVKYQHDLKEMLKGFQNLGIKVKLIKSRVNWRDRWSYKGYQLATQKQQKHLPICAAVVDISAMEMQLINKNIPTMVLFDQQCVQTLIFPKLIEHLYDTSQSMQSLQVDQFNFDDKHAEIQKHRNYLIGYHQPHLAQLSFRQRIQWLCTYTQQHRDLLNQSNIASY